MPVFYQKSLPLYPPLFEKERGKEERGASPLLNTPYLIHFCHHIVLFMSPPFVKGD
jgi:hypothetical protein